MAPFIRYDLLREKDKAIPGEPAEREFADALARAKRARGLTQKGLAAALGTSQATVSKLLSGRQRPRPRLALRIEKFVSSSEETEAPIGITAVAAAYAQSADFRRLCDAALKLYDLENINE